MATYIQKNYPDYLVEVRDCNGFCPAAEHANSVYQAKKWVKYNYKKGFDLKVKIYKRDKKTGYHRDEPIRNYTF